MAKQTQGIPAPPDALSALARLFWDAAIEEVAARIDKEEAEKHKQKSVAETEEAS